MPMPSKDISGKKFDMLTAQTIIDKKNGANLWLCLCDCGQSTTAIVTQLERGDKTSCGCKKKHKRKPRPDLSLRNKKNAVHAMAGSATYRSWNSMIERCCNPTNKDYKNYGARGIKVCDEWKSFINFLNDMGERPNGTTIDRIDNNGNYEKSNCRWASQKQQSNNTRKNYYITFNGKTQTARQWADEVKAVEYKTLLYRLRSGWDIEKALTTSSLIKRK